MHLRKKSIK